MAIISAASAAFYDDCYGIDESELVLCVLVIRVLFSGHLDGWLVSDSGLNLQIAGILPQRKSHQVHWYRSGINIR